MKPLSFFLLSCLISVGALAQVELEPWGNINGIRVAGQLIPFGTSIRVGSVSTAKERQHPHYFRRGGVRGVDTRIDSVLLHVVVRGARVTVSYRATAAEHVDGIYFLIHYLGDSVWCGTHRLRADTAITVHRGDLSAGDSASVTLNFRVSGKPDRTPVHLVLGPPGERTFDGFGGNFRIQNLKLDPEVIDYNLQNLRVAWGRVEMPWRFWQPVLSASPQDTAPQVVRAMQMAQRLGQKGIPLILSAWFPPDWAIIGPFKGRPGTDGVWGNPLDTAHMADIYKSIADYVEFLKVHYGTEIRFFSFNESDLGINVRMTGEEHEAFIKGMGAYFASRRLKTRVLLGDNSDATTYSFTYPTLEDTGALRYAGAVSFHSWRGFDSATLRHWRDIADRAKLPLLVAEGSIDAAAWGYPDIFLEPSYAIREIGLYIRLLAICRPISILQWQLTSDYSLLTGGGIFGDTGKLRPTQRFWNMAQLASTPPGLHFLDISADRPNISCAALGEGSDLVVHIVNDGAARDAILSGIPDGINELSIWVTDQHGHGEQYAATVLHGAARVHLLAESYVTLRSHGY